MNNDNFVPENNPENEVNISPEIARRIKDNMFSLNMQFYALSNIHMTGIIGKAVKKTDKIFLDVQENHEYGQLEKVYEKLQRVKIEAARTGHQSLRYIVMAEFYCLEILADVIVVKPRNEPPSYANIGWVNGGES